VNSSLRRVLSFGAPVEAGGDEARIREGRRELLLTIAGAAETTRRFVETVAASENVPLDALYGMLKVLGIDASDPGQIEAQLKAGAERLKALMETRTGATLTDVELVRLSKLADEAQAEGAINVALSFREQASARADALELTVDENEANLRADRLQIGATYAEHAITAELNFDFARSAEMWRKAIGQVEDWDETLTAGYRNNLGVVLMYQGELDTGAEALEESVAMLRASLATFEGSDPVNWARTQSNLGNTLHKLGDRERDPNRYLEAVEAHRAALEILTRETRPEDWATAEMNLGNALARIGEYEEGTESLEAAIDAFRAALEIRTREARPLDWAAANDNLGSALSVLAGRTGDAGLFAQGIDAFRNTLTVRSKDGAPLDWGRTQRNLGLALKTYGVMAGDLEAIEEGAGAYRAALEVFTLERSPMEFAQTSAILAFALMEIAKLEPTAALLEEARGRFADAKAVFGPLSADDDAYFEGRIAEIDEMLGG
jgi:tetratricopeptide (TPR) repeat protein